MTAERRINLALQGGGAHGAFTWGVLHALLEDRRVSFRAISGASAGALNAAVMATGLLESREKAMRLLEDFWRGISAASPFGALSASRPPQAFGFQEGRTAKGVMQGLEALSQLFSPGPHPASIRNPLRPILAGFVDFGGLRSRPVPALHVAATDVRKGCARIFGNAGLSVEALLASACLPQLFPAVEIDGAHYWDGGFTANPPLLPLAQDRNTPDILIVRINALATDTLPRTGPAIAGRLGAICFNAPLLAEWRGLSGRPDLFFHAIADDELMAMLPPESKLTPGWDFLLRLHDAGYRRGRVWLEENYDFLGQRSTVQPETLLDMD